MATHKFSIGERVVFANRQVLLAAPGEYEVLQLLPEGAGGFHYRLKSELEKYERVVPEDQLARKTTADASAATLSERPPARSTARRHALHGLDR